MASNDTEALFMQIVCFGDSNTYGYDPRSYIGDRYDAKDRWVDLLAKSTGWECVNAGSNGREIPRLSPVPAVCKEADLLLIMLGSNDLLQGATAKEAADRMEAFLQRILPDCKKILLISPPPMTRGAWVLTDELVAESITLADAYRSLAETLSISFVDTRPWSIELAFDGVHFTEAGHRAFAAHLTKHIP
jgi:lysophospholipase L1-like esterase